MAFEYSLFFSYRRDDEERDFIICLKNKLKSIARKSIDFEEVFFDEESIDWGKEFDDKIYDGILSSCFFIPIWQTTYLSKRKLWCAYELFYAIKVEEEVRNSVNPEFCFILPIIRIDPNSLHENIMTKNFIDIRNYLSAVTRKKPTKKFIELENKIAHILRKNAWFVEEEDFQSLCSQIKKPSKEEIIEWINSHNQRIKEIECGKSPLLRKNK